jgi:hypothetical protein
MGGLYQQIFFRFIDAVPLTLKMNPTPSPPLSKGRGGKAGVGFCEVTCLLKLSLEEIAIAEKIFHKL